MRYSVEMRTQSSEKQNTVADNIIKPPILSHFPPYTEPIFSTDFISESYNVTTLSKKEMRITLTVFI